MRIRLQIVQSGPCVIEFTAPGSESWSVVAIGLFGSLKLRARVKLCEPAWRLRRTDRSKALFN